MMLAIKRLTNPKSKLLLQQAEPKAQEAMYFHEPLKHPPVKIGIYL